MYHKIIVTVFSLLLIVLAPAQHQANSVYQYAVPVESRTAYLWIPPDCKRVRGLILSFANLLERNWLEDPVIRKTAAGEGLGIVWVSSGRNTVLTADLKPGAGAILQQMFKDLADESGYSEIEYAPIISMGHSANGQLSWAIPNWNPERTIAAIAVKTVPFPASFTFENVPVCYIVGQTTEWPQYRVPDPAAKPGDRDFFWPVVRESALTLRSVNQNNLIGVVTDPGGGHFDWSEKQAKFIALYIRKACKYRLPETTSATGPVKLKTINKESGWLTDAGGMEPDAFKPASYKAYKGDPSKAYWFFDEETAKAAVAFNGDRIKRKKQMLSFIQDGHVVPVAKLGFAALKFQPEKDALHFKVNGNFLSEMPVELMGAGTKLGHAEGSIRYSVIDGPAVQSGPGIFRVQFNRGNIGGSIWLQEEHPGDHQFRHAVQPGQINIPAKLTQGELQSITFPGINNQKEGATSVVLNAVSDSGLPVDYYVVSGPAYIEGNQLRLTKIPTRSKYPVKITVVAYQWGRAISPLFQSAAPVRQTFLLEK